MREIGRSLSTCFGILWVFCILSKTLGFVPSTKVSRSLLTPLCATIESVKNFRPVVPGSSLYRSATLDDLTENDARCLLDGSAFGKDNKAPLTIVIDLRNPDEIEKGKRKQTTASRAFYASSEVDFRRIPVLANVDAFWDEVIDTMDPGERMMATLQTIVVGGALDRAAARHLEKGGLPLLYAIMMKTGGRPLAMALEACLEALESKRSLIFHCQKGKDRTGILAMLLQICLSDSNDGEIVDAYAISGDLLGEFPNKSTPNEESSSSSTIDWSYFRGSPAYAMEETLAWVRREYGSVEAYLDSVSFGVEKRSRLRDHCPTG